MNNELMHYGILGMKWGVRRTPEQLGHKLKYTSPTIEKLKSTGAFAAKKIIATAIPGAGLLFSTMSIATLATSLKNNMDKSDYVKIEGDIEKLKELKRKSDKNSNAVDDMKKINPRLPGQKGTVNNCMYCTAAMEMRRRGYDVRARKKAYGLAETAYEDWFENVKLEHPKLERLPNESRKKYVQRSYDNLCNEIEKNGNGSRGYVGITYEKLYTGHSMYWEVSNGRVVFYDGQSKSVNNDKLFSLSDPSSYSYARLDNLKLRDNITETVISIKDEG